MTTTRSEKLYIVTRSNLKPGQQASQLVHVAREFQEAWPDIERKWYQESNTIVLLSVANETELRNLASKAKDKGIKTALFREPDLKNALTAIALEPCEQTASLCSGIALALRNKLSAHGETKVSPPCPPSSIPERGILTPKVPSESLGEGAKSPGIWRWLKQIFC